MPYSYNILRAYNTWEMVGGPKVRWDLTEATIKAHVPVHILTCVMETLSVDGS